MQTIIACDPGASGGFAVKTNDGIELISMPDTQTDIVKILSKYKTANAELWIEDIPKFCGVKIPSSTTAVLFENFGFVKGAAVAMGYALHKIPPKEWQEPLGLGGKKSCANASEWKRKLKNKAQELYPGLDVTLKNCDALLLLHFQQGGHK